MTAFDPEFFIPLEKIVLPMQEDDAVVLEILAQSKITVLESLGATAFMHFYSPLVPEWRRWEDGAGGNLHVLDHNDDEVGLATLTDDIQEAPYNNDGLVIHDDQNVVVTFGYKEEDCTSLLWGALSKPLEDMLVDPASTDIFYVGAEYPYLKMFHNRMFGE